MFLMVILQKQIDCLKLYKNILFLVVFYMILLLFRLQNGNFYLADSLEYLKVTKHLISGNYFSTIDEVVIKRPIIYPLFLALTLTQNSFVILFFQAVLLFFTFNIFIKIIKFHKLEFNLLLIIFILCTPAIFIYSQLVMSELLVLFFLTLLLHLFLVNFSWDKIKYIQIILMLLAFTKPVFYPFVFINFIVFVYYFFKERKFNYWIFLPVLSVLLSLNYNYSRFGIKEFSSIENQNLIYYNLYYFKSNKQSKAIADTWIKEVEKNVGNLNSKQQNIKYKQIAKHEISQNIVSYSTYHFLTGIRGIFDPGRFDLMTFVVKEDGKQGFLEILNGNKSWKSLFNNPKIIFIYFLLFLIFISLIVKWLYFFKYFLNSKRSFNQYYFLILIFYYILVTGPVNCSRYMMPLQLILITFAMLSIKEFKTKHASKNQSDCNIST